MSAQNKTEKATPKKRRDAGERGQSFKAHDLVVTCLTIGGVIAVLSLDAFSRIGAVLVNVMRSGFEHNTAQYARNVVLEGFWMVVPIVAVAIVCSAIPSLLQSGFQLATKAVRIDLEAINPMRGFRKIFSLRSAKDVVKTLLYLCTFGVSLWIVWLRNRTQLFAQYHGNLHSIVLTWKAMVIDLVLVSFTCIFVVLVLDALAELYFYLKDLRMDRQEVKREFREMEGDPHIKSKRREWHLELLSSQDRHDIENSRMLVVNPTHVAIGIYFKPEVSPIPYVSVKASDFKALAARKYAEQVGVPVIVDVPLARRMYQSHDRYAMVSMIEIRPIVALLLWLQDVERNAACPPDGAGDRGDAMPEGDAEAPREAPPES
ncbi:type III secretion protein U [Cupriavidus sp. YR651]|uniref:EscU/YscU/HrcU family type III secretion system export apparatus switch protein n=1 Tax=Cupriavidus sp. YR651 TaxID=1855315 RepID=UPI0008906C7D|nr:EscU/YscU/HrcU family type III secretion system export apparatus switch protein [Cupriavidus sp. YR651]SDD38541.1 type III secretion protein U [Cupriavidus sp. YR651]